MLWSRRLMLATGMPKKEPFHLHSVSDVLTAEQHNPSLFNPDFLTHNRIIPTNWQVVEALTTPVLANLRFDNGITVTVEPGKLRITEDCDSRFRASYSLHKMLAKLVGALPHVPYKALGINARVSLAKEQSEDWLVERFLRRGKWLASKPRLIGASIRLTYEAVDAVCNLSLTPGEATSGGQGPEPAVIIDANFHHEDASSAEKIRRILKRSDEKQEYLIDALQRLLVKPLR